MRRHWMLLRSSEHVGLVQLRCPLRRDHAHKRVEIMRAVKYNLNLFFSCFPVVLQGDHKWLKFRMDQRITQTHIFQFRFYRLHIRRSQVVEISYVSKDNPDTYYQFRFHRLHIRTHSIRTNKFQPSQLTNGYR
jgi:hypothetical protein